MLWARRISQGLFLAVFLLLFIQTEQKGADELGWPVKVFLEFDPLHLISSLLAGHAVAKGMLLGLALLLLTALLGRVFCGWICPLGTLHNLVGALRKAPDPQRGPAWFRMKYLILVILLGGALGGMNLAGILDPLSLLIRSMSLGIYPAFNAAVNGLMDLAAGTQARVLVAPSEAVYGLLKKSVLAFQQPHFLQGTLLSLLFLGLLLINLKERRFWCRYLCPLGALLGIAGRWAFLKREVAEGCTGCGICDRECQGLGITKGRDWKASECFYCWNCDDPCPKSQVSFGFSARPAPGDLDLGRRRVLLAGAAGLAGAAASKAAPHALAERVDPLLIRPPGSRPEADFLARCVKCGECMKVCTTNGLQPLDLRAGLEGLWTPVLVPRIGYCEYRCTLCGQVCPTGAIERLPVERKVAVKIGLAQVDRSRCLPWAFNTPCIVCEEVCPIPEKAVYYDLVQGKDRNGNPVELKQPRVDTEKCTGCAICETKCPVVDRPAIFVTSITESRSRKNQLILGSGYGG
ncbi:MAG: 4Fe-4S binding protein [Acidobacteria bacterium]|nr:4Fe-4S binding protein [Acidobacteriota bacterium]